MNKVDVTIIGCGPAGMSAALYLVRGGATVAIFEGEGIGGQMAKAPLIENYPGFTGSGADLADIMFEQIANKVDLYLESVVEVDRTPDDVYITTGEFGAKVESDNIIIATGGKPIKLDIPGINGDNVHYCVTCDGALYADKVATVIGGGNSAMQYALELSTICKEVHLLVLLDELMGEKIWKERILNSNVHIHYNFDTAEITDHSVISHTGEEVETDGVFMAIGYTPNVPNLKHIFCPVTTNGLINAGYRLETEMGCYAIGDVRVKPFRQVVSAANDGMNAALFILQCITMKESKDE